MRGRLKVLDWLLAVVMATGGGLVGSAAWLVGSSTSFAVGIAGFVWMFVLVLLVILLYRRLIDQLSKRACELRDMVGKEMENSYRQTEALMNLRAELGVEKALPPMRGWAISPDFAELLLTQLKTSSPVNVLECGSGVSTIVIARFLQKQGDGYVVSLEHDATHVEASEKLISEHRLQDYASILHAPLVPYQCDGRECLWYDVSGLGSGDRFDFLVVDGPPSDTGELARYPLLHVMADRIAQGATIILDDSGRPDEKKVLECWLKENRGAKLTIVDVEKGAAIIKYPDTEC